MSSLTLPPIPKGWGYVRLEDLIEPDGLSYGIVQPGSEDVEGVPILRVKNLQNGMQTDDVIRVSPEVERQYRRSRLKGGEVLLSLVGSVGTVAIAPLHFSGWNVARAIAVIRVRDQANLWVKYYLSSDVAQHYMHVWKTTTVQATLNLRDVRRLPVALPPRLERDVIVTLLMTLDDKIAVNDKIAAAGEALAIALSSDEQQVTTVPLKEIVGYVREQVLPETIVTERVAYYSIPAFDSMRLPEMATPGSIKSSKFIVSAPSVLVSKLNPSIPRVWNVDPSQGIPALASTEFLVLRPSQGITTDELWAVCGQPSFTVSLMGKVTGTSNSHQRVKPADLLATEVVDPRTLPDEIRGSISAVARRVRQARIESQSLVCLRDALLPKLMSGQIRVRDAERIVEDAT
jgi:type I restriction enzyme S subunit